MIARGWGWMVFVVVFTFGVELLYDWRPTLAIAMLAAFTAAAWWWAGPSRGRSE